MPSPSAIFTHDLPGRVRVDLKTMAKAPKARKSIERRYQAEDGSIVTPYQTFARRWSRAQIISAMKGWAAGHGGRAPTMREWREPEFWDDTSRGLLPQYASRPITSYVLTHFGRWNLAVEAAGLEPRRPGEQERETRSGRRHPDRTRHMVTGRERQSWEQT
jgi:hypothetical protein